MSSDDDKASKNALKKSHSVRLKEDEGVSPVRGRNYLKVADSPIHNNQ